MSMSVQYSRFYGTHFFWVFQHFRGGMPHTHLVSGRGDEG